MRIVIIASYLYSLINFRGTLLKELVQLGYEVIALSPVSKFDQEVLHELSTIGVKFYPINLESNSLNPFLNLYNLFMLFHKLRILSPSMIIAYTAMPVIYAGLSTSVFNFIFRKSIRYYPMITGLGLPFSYSSKFSFKKLLVKYILLILYRVSLLNAKSVVFQNEDDYLYFIQNNIINIQKRYLIVDGSGVDLDKFNMSSLPKENIFLLIARLLPEKGIHEYIQAARKVLMLYPNTIFLLAGPISKNYSSISKSEIKTWIEEGLIEYLGYVKPIQQAINKAKFVVLPSYYREGIPRSLIEALAMGRPIITTDEPGCRETVIPGENGYLIPSRDSDLLAESMICLIHQTNLKIKNMSLSSRRLAINKFDVRLINKDLLNHFFNY